MNNLTKIAFIFIANWVAGEVAQSTYAQNLSWSIMITLMYVFFTGMHIDLWKSLKTEMRVHFG